MRYSLYHLESLFYAKTSKTELTNLHVRLVICDSAGVMYWGDAQLDKIEMAYLNGTGRTVLLIETNVHYFDFLLHGVIIYFTDDDSRYVHFIFTQRQRAETRRSLLLTLACGGQMK